MIEIQSSYLHGEDLRCAERIGASMEPELRQLLPTLADPVRVQIGTEGRVIPQLGFGARSVTVDSIQVTLDPDHRDGNVGLLQTHLRPVLFHECHHLVRGWVMHGGMRPLQLIEAVICEGLGSAFERDAAGHSNPWCSYPETVRSWVDELLKLPINAPYVQWMFAHPDGRQWVGYRAGVFIADRAMAASERSAAELAQTPYEEILRLADLPLPNKPLNMCRLIIQGFRSAPARRSKPS